MVESGDFYGSGKLPDASWAGYFYASQAWDVNPAAEVRQS